VKAPIAVFAIVMLCAWTISLGAAPHATPAPTESAHVDSAPESSHSSHAPAANQSVLPPPGIRWPAVMMIIVLGMFLAAMVVGPVVRMTLPEEPPVSHGHDAHDDDHGHGHGHARPRTPLDDHGHAGHH
jgi:hypothetical protein